MTGNPELIDQYRRIHASAAYGTTSVKNLRFIRPEIQLLKPASIVDYGCGQSQLVDLLELRYPANLVRYDPAIPAFAHKPAGVFDLLINVDVLEHIEETDVDDVIGEMRSLCRHALIIIDTKPAKKLLSDGRNAHVTIRSHGWWQARLARHFDHLEAIGTVRRSRAGFRTWPRKPGDSARFLRMRATENMRHLASRLSGQHKAHEL
jgi:hypothetical protein